MTNIVRKLIYRKKSFSLQSRYYQLMLLLYHLFLYGISNKVLKFIYHIFRALTTNMYSFTSQILLDSFTNTEKQNHVSLLKLSIIKTFLFLMKCLLIQFNILMMHKGQNGHYYALEMSNNWNSLKKVKILHVKFKNYR